MFRLTHYLRALADPYPLPPVRKPAGPVVIWNLIRRCNLKCKHCYTTSGDVDFPGELSTEQAYEVIDDLKGFRVPVIIFSGGEPLMRPDMLELSAHAKQLGFYTALSTNGTLIDKEMARKIGTIGYDYVGISLDGIGKVHDDFRGMDGAFDLSLQAVRHLREENVKVGLRFTLTEDNADILDDYLDLCAREKVDKIYLSHLVYAGRGNKNRGEDAHLNVTRKAMTRLIEKAWEDVLAESSKEYVTGNNDADGIYLLQWVRENMPEKAGYLEDMLERWGGNASGVNIGNIDNTGKVHPDSFWWHYTIGNVKERKFSEIWQDVSDPVMAGLKQTPRQIKGRCGSCQYFNICNGNTRVRALQLTGDPWAEDPSCYLTDEEIGLEHAHHQRVETTPFRGARHEAKHVYA